MKEIFSFLVLMSGIALGWSGVEWFENPIIQLVWYAIAYLPVGLPVLKEAWEHILKKEFFNEFMLMGIASLGAFYIGEYEEGVAVMLFYCVGEMFQERAVRRAKMNIKALLDVRPQTANVVRDGVVGVVDPSTVAIGEILEVRVGERVPLDGVMLSEAAYFNTSAITGESVPRKIGRDEELLAGMIVTDCVVKVRVTKLFCDSAISRILEMVEEASARKAPVELLIRRFAKIYTPIVVLLASLIVALPFLWSLVDPQFVYLFESWFYRALIFLVISCPCALVVSIPLGYFGGLGAASKNGILFKGGSYLDAVTKIDTFVFDKTGTLTKGLFEVQKVQSSEIVSDDQLLCMVASVERYSTHPIAKAIVAATRLSDLMPVEAVVEVAGRGLKAIVGDQEVLVGNARLLAESNISFPENVLSKTQTVVFCAVDGCYWGAVLLADRLKEDTQSAIEELRGMGINKFIILSGDKQAIVGELGERLGIKEAYGDLLPEEKLRRVEKIVNDRTNFVAFVGDGINDAPVLALSNVGIAMGSMGSDVAIETADVVIQTDQLSKLPTAIRIGRQTQRIVVQNIVMAFGVKLAVMALGVWGVATMWEAVFADVGVALLAILNAVRVQKMNYGKRNRM